MRKQLILLKKLKIKDAIEITDIGKKKIDLLTFETNFDYMKINSLFSNLEIFKYISIIKTKDFENVGLSVSDIKIQLNRIFLYQ